MMTKPLAALYWVKINARRQQPHPRHHHHDAATPNGLKNNLQPEPQSWPRSAWRKVQNKLQRSHE
jgi:hypothetical protein